MDREELARLYGIQSKVDEFVTQPAGGGQQFRRGACRSMPPRSPTWMRSSRRYTWYTNVVDQASRTIMAMTNPARLLDRALLGTAESMQRLRDVLDPKVSLGQDITSITAQLDQLEAKRKEQGSLDIKDRITKANLSQELFRLREEEHQLIGEIDDGTSKWELSTKAGRRNIAMAIEAAERIRELTLSYVRQGDTIEEATAKTKPYRDQLQGQLADAGMTQAAISQLTDVYLAVPDVVATAFRADVGEAWAAYRRWVAALDGIDPSVMTDLLAGDELGRAAVMSWVEFLQATIPSEIVTTLRTITVGGGGGEGSGGGGSGAVGGSGAGESVGWGPGGRPNYGELVTSAVDDHSSGDNVGSGGLLPGVIDPKNSGGNVGYGGLLPGVVDPKNSDGRAVHPDASEIDRMLGTGGNVGSGGLLPGVVDPKEQLSSILDRVPHGASGGIADHPMLAMIGESGPEALIPLSDMGGGDTIINMNVNVNVAGSVTTEDDLTDKVASKLARIGLRGGKLN